jgi:uracil-DNA glycosylase family 4
MPQLFNIHAKYSKPPECRSCLLEYDGRGFSEPEGTGALHVLCVAESLGDHEVRDGLPLRPHAPAGSVFERALKKCGLSRSQVAVWNIVACQPPHNDLHGYEGAMDHCRVHFRRVMERYRPRVILALGNVPLHSLTGMTGDRQTVEHVRGYPLECPEFPGVWVISTYHPSYIVRGAWNVFGAFCNDIRYAIDIARNGFNPRAVEYIEHAGTAELAHINHECLSDEQLVMSIDFETEGNVGVYEDEQLETALRELYDEKKARKKIEKKTKLGTDQQITSLNISIAEGQSFVFDWSADLAGPCAGLLALPNPKIGHNIFAFDTPVAEYNGCIINGVVDDTMLMFHHLYPDLPGRRGKVGEAELDGSFANLQYCASFARFDQPWKHLVKDQPGFYGCLAGNSLVQTDDGFKKIRDLVKYRYQGFVWGVDENGCLQRGKVYNWIKNKHKEPVKWLSVETKHTRNGKHGPMVTRYTPDHQLMTPNGWREIQNLKAGDKLLLPDVQLSGVERQVVIGSMLYETEVVRVFENPISKGRRDDIRTSYCLDVGGIHSFLTPYEAAHNCCDSDATLRLYNWLRRDMVKLRYGTYGPTIWDSYVKLVADLWPALRDASRRGIPTNKEKLLMFLDSVVRKQRAIGENIQRVIPEALLPVKNKTGYKKTPKDTTGLVLQDFKLEAESKRCKCFRVRKKDIEKWSALAEAEYSQKDGKLRAPDPNCIWCFGSGWLELPERIETRWCKLERFNPGSHVQMKAYANYMHHKIPLNKERKRAMDKWTLDQLAKKTRDPLYRSTIEYRQFEKMASYAIQWMPKPVDADKGWLYPAAHPEFSFFPATGQLSSFNPNAQNVMSLSKYGPLAFEFRDAVEAPPGYKIIEADEKSFHVQTLGFEANCPSYIRLAKLDVHSYLAGCLKKLPYFDQCIDWDDAALLDFLKWHRKNYVFPDGTPFQKVRDERAKVAVLAFGLGQMANSLFEGNRDSFLPRWFLDKNEHRELVTDIDIRKADREGIHEAQLVHDTLNERFPELSTYRENTPLIARQHGDRLISRYGCVRWFYDITHWDARRREMVHGTDWEKAIAFPVQNDAHGYLKYALLRMNAPLAHDERGMLERYGFINTVHDSVVFCCPDALLDEALPNIKRELERPSEVLTFADGSGLSVECEVKVGRTWAAMKEVTI